MSRANVLNFLLLLIGTLTAATGMHAARRPDWPDGRWDPASPRSSQATRRRRCSRQARGSTALRRRPIMAPATIGYCLPPIAAADDVHNIRVRVGSCGSPALTLHATYSDGSMLTFSTSSTSSSRYVQLGAIMEFPLPWRHARVTRLLWRVDGSPNMRGIVAGLRLADARESAHANTMMAAIYAGFAGIAFALLIYNLSLWWALRYRFQLAYCGMIVALLGYALSSSGALAWIAPAIDNNDRIRINYTMLGLAAAGAIAFARTFFEPRIFDGWLRRTTDSSAIALLAASGLSFAAVSHIDVRIADRAASFVFLIGLIVVAPILWHAWARGSRYLWLFALAWAAPIAFAGVRIMAALNLFESNFWLDNSTVLSLAFEALVSSLAIAYRVQMLSRERDDALAGELQARLLADADPLTGLLNRRAFLTQAVGRPDAQMLHLIDIDHFKAVNDTLGHDGGTRCCACSPAPCAPQCRAEG